jgi:hypothetical protein
MKTRLLLGVCAMALLAIFGGGPATGQTEASHGQSGQDHQHHWNMDHPAFDDHEHVVMRDWYRDHRLRPPLGFRERDLLPAEMEKQLVVGFVLPSDFQRRAYLVPGDLFVQLPPPPPGYRYRVISGRLCLIDHDWRIHDIIRVQIDVH